MGWLKKRNSIANAQELRLSCTNPWKGKLIAIAFIRHIGDGHKTWWYRFKTLRPRQNGRHFADDTFKRIFLNENFRISIKLFKFIPKGPINNNPALVQIMAWCQPGDKPLSEPMMLCLLTHICVTRPQWVNGISSASNHTYLITFKTVWYLCCFHNLIWIDGCTTAYHWLSSQINPSSACVPFDISKSFYQRCRITWLE